MTNRLFKVLDGINSSDAAAETLADYAAIESYAEACGESITRHEAERIAAVGKKWRDEQANGKRMVADAARSNRGARRHAELNHRASQPTPTQEYAS